jgi:ABC-2 type transport system permease protein
MAALTALTTQFVWGLMECLAYKALLDSDAIAFPMEYSALVSYVWLKEAFLALFNTWAADNDIFGLITDGGIAYELCRPVSIYTMWFSRNIGGRIAEAILRCIPVLVGATLLPRPYGISAPDSFGAFILFAISMFLALAVTVSFCMLIYMLCFFTISPQGWRMLFMGAVELLSGSIIPIPFIPQPYRSIVEILPFASMHNVPLRIYSGDLMGNEMIRAILLQIIWFAVLLRLGIWLCKRAEHRIVVQGG